MNKIQEARNGAKKWWLLIVLMLVIAGGIFFWFVPSPFRLGFEITDDLGGNIFPSAILSVATTDAQVIQPSDTMYVGNPKSTIAVRVRSAKALSRVRVEVAESRFYARSVSEFVLDRAHTNYVIYPDIVWNYEALKNNLQAEPISVLITAEMNGKDLGQKVRTFSVRSINECLLGYVSNGKKYHDTGIFFAAYVNEDHPMIDQVLREALNTRIVNRFLGIRQVRPKLSIVRCMHCGMYCKNDNSAIVRWPIPVCRAMWFFRSVCALSKMPSIPHKSIAWTEACFLRHCSGPLISCPCWCALPDTCLWAIIPTRIKKTLISWKPQ